MSRRAAYSTTQRDVQPRRTVQIDRRAAFLQVLEGKTEANIIRRPAKVDDDNLDNIDDYFDSDSDKNTGTNTQRTQLTKPIEEPVDEDSLILLESPEPSRFARDFGQDRNPSDTEDFMYSRISDPNYMLRSSSIPMDGRPSVAMSSIAERSLIHDSMLTDKSRLSAFENAMEQMNRSEASVEANHSQAKRKDSSLLVNTSTKRVKRAKPSAPSTSKANISLNSNQSAINASSITAISSVSRRGSLKKATPNQSTTAQPQTQRDSSIDNSASAASTANEVSRESSMVHTPTKQPRTTEPRSSAKKSQTKSSSRRLLSTPPSASKVVYHNSQENRTRTGIEAVSKEIDIAGQNPQQKTPRLSLSFANSVGVENISSSKPSNASRKSPSAPKTSSPAHPISSRVKSPELQKSANRSKHRDSHEGTKSNSNRGSIEHHSADQYLPSSQKNATSISNEIEKLSRSKETTLHNRSLNRSGYSQNRRALEFDFEENDDNRGDVGRAPECELTPSPSQQLQSQEGGAAQGELGKGKSKGKGKGKSDKVQKLKEAAQDKAQNDEAVPAVRITRGRRNPVIASGNETPKSTSNPGKGESATEALRNTPSLRNEEAGNESQPRETQTIIGQDSISKDKQTPTEAVPGNNAGSDAPAVPARQRGKKRAPGKNDTQMDTQDTHRADEVVEPSSQDKPSQENVPHPTADVEEQNVIPHVEPTPIPENEIEHIATPGSVDEHPARPKVAKKKTKKSVKVKTESKAKSKIQVEADHDRDRSAVEADESGHQKVNEDSVVDDDRTTETGTVSKPTESRVTTEPKELKTLSEKAAYRAYIATPIEEAGIKLLEKEDQEEDQTEIRRSKRIRLKPLEFWKNERAVYHRKDKELPTIDVVIRVDKDDEMDEMRVRNKPKPKPVYDAEKIPVPSHGEQGARIFDKKRGTVERHIAQSKEMLSFIEMKKLYEDLGDHSFKEEGIQVATALDHKNFATGVLHLRPNAVKPIQNTFDLTEVFYVSSGDIEVTCHESKFTLWKGSFFYIPPHNLYTIKNLSDSKPVTLIFSIIRLK